MGPPFNPWIVLSNPFKVYRPVVDPPHDAHFMPDTSFSNEDDTWVFYLFDIDKKGEKKKEEEKEGILV